RRLAEVAGTHAALTVAGVVAALPVRARPAAAAAAVDAGLAARLQTIAAGRACDRHAALEAELVSGAGDQMAQLAAVGRRVAGAETERGAVTRIFEAEHRDHAGVARRRRDVETPDPLRDHLGELAGFERGDFHRTEAGGGGRILERRDLGRLALPW